MENISKARRELLRQDFMERLPKNLGEPYVMNTLEWPFIFVAFYEPQEHEMADGKIINGPELRLLKYSNGFSENKILGGIVGMCQDQPTLVALRCCATRAKDLRPYQQMILEMLLEVATHAHD